MRYLAPTILIALTLAACATPPLSPPVAPPTAAPRPSPTPQPSPTAAPLAADWRDWPFTPGDWTYLQQPGRSAASFAVGTGTVMLSCDRSARRIVLSGILIAPLTIRTTTMTRAITPTRVDGDPPYAQATLEANDPLLDAIVFSRGRFVVEQPGRLLVLPPYAEIGRVIEDCRG